MENNYRKQAENLLFMLNEVFAGQRAELIETALRQVAEDARKEEREALEETITKARKEADQAYLDMIKFAEKDECKGKDYKLETGTFTKANLEAHTKMQEKYGEYSGGHLACNTIIAAIRNRSTQENEG